MTNYKIIHEIKIDGKSIVTLDKERTIEDMDKKKVIIDNESFEYSLSHGNKSIIINTVKKLNGKNIQFS